MSRVILAAAGGGALGWLAWLIMDPFVALRPVPLILGVMLASGLLDWVAAWQNERHTRAGTLRPRNSLHGARATAVADFHSPGPSGTGGPTYRGSVKVGGETWAARSRAAIRSGQAVRVGAREGLTLWVDPAD